MNSKFENLKQKNAANIQKMEKATNLTIVDSEQWTALINTVKNLNEQMNMNRQEVLITATEQNLDETKTAVENQATNLKTVLDTASKSMTESIAEQTEALSQQVGRQNEQFGFQMNNLSETTSHIKKKTAATADWNSYGGASVIYDSLYFVGNLSKLIENPKHKPRRIRGQLTQREKEKKLAHGQKIDDDWGQSM